jgi:16S rRNA G1207 methylase RsmC
LWFAYTVSFTFAEQKWLFSSKGGDIQNKVLDLLMSHIDWDGHGRALDIGCGKRSFDDQDCQEIS